MDGLCDIQLVFLCNWFFLLHHQTKHPKMLNSYQLATRSIQMLVSTVQLDNTIQKCKSKKVGNEKVNLLIMVQTYR